MAWMLALSNRAKEASASIVNVLRNYVDSHSDSFSNCEILVLVHEAFNSVNVAV